MICPHCNKKIEEGKWLNVSDVLGKGYEIEIEVHDKNRSWDDLGLKNKEDELLTYDSCVKLANSKYAKQLKMDGSSSNDDFFIQQPFNLSRKNGYVARFCAGSGYAYLNCSYYSSNSSGDLGVRFVRKIKGKR